MYFYNLEYDYIKSEEELTNKDRLEVLELVPLITCDEDMHFVMGLMCSDFTFSESLEALENEKSWSGWKAEQ